MPLHPEARRKHTVFSCPRESGGSQWQTRVENHEGDFLTEFPFGLHKIRQTAAKTRDLSIFMAYVSSGFLKLVDYDLSPLHLYPIHLFTSIPRKKIIMLSQVPKSTFMWIILY